MTQLHMNRAQPARGYQRAAPAIWAVTVPYYLTWLVGNMHRMDNFSFPYYFCNYNYVIYFTDAVFTQKMYTWVHLVISLNQNITCIYISQIWPIVTLSYVRNHFYILFLRLSNAKYIFKFFILRSTTHETVDYLGLDYSLSVLKSYF